MSERNVSPLKGSVNPRDQVMSGNVVIGSSGAVSSQTGAQAAGFTVTKNAAAGRYDVAFYKTFKSIKSAHCQMVGPASAGFPTTTGSDPQLRTFSTSAATVQFKRTDTQGDEDAASGTVLLLTFVVSDS